METSATPDDEDTPVLRMLAVVVCLPFSSCGFDAPLPIAYCYCYRTTQLYGGEKENEEYRFL